MFIFWSESNVLFFLVGDCYVAAAGLPTPCDDHAVVMATFARRCLDKMLSLVIDLEVTLGPGTAELGMRFGLHSGPTIGGVLRGTKVRAWTISTPVIGKTYY
jgi:class 3 adenylate cyclase